jgi:hypothetical protein
MDLAGFAPLAACGAFKVSDRGHYLLIVILQDDENSFTG